MTNAASTVEVVPDTPGVTDVPGFRAVGVAADIRQQGARKRLDVAVVYSERPCEAAGVFTTNDFKAAPVRLCQEYLAGGLLVRAIVANSGNANACTGPQGLADAEAMAQMVATELGLMPQEVLVASTGRIGRALPMAAVVQGTQSACTAIREQQDRAQGGRDAAEAILTSDTRSKTVTARFSVEGQTVTLAGMAKGAGMIEPNMATMLGFLTTDAGASSDLLHHVLRTAVKGTFNACTVDGDCSTNDTVLLLANGASGVTISHDNPAAMAAFQEAVTAVCRVLAEKIVGDGERITKVVRLQIEGAADDEAAEKVARKVGNSLLVKTSWFGSDPNWGRIAHAIGAARVGVDVGQLDLFYDDVPVVVAGHAVDDNLPQWREIVARKHFGIRANLHQGSGTFTLLSTDLSTGYVDFNKSE
ncbi:MAG: bifunctional glutamate N-acetyltransferase/amino-acid acetyltransferase ArgJ [Opitutales bacterium]